MALKYSPFAMLGTLLIVCFAVHTTTASCDNPSLIDQDGLEGLLRQEAAPGEGLGVSYTVLNYYVNCLVSDTMKGSFIFATLTMEYVVIPSESLEPRIVYIDLACDRRDNKWFSLFALLGVGRLANDTRTSCSYCTGRPLVGTEVTIPAGDDMYHCVRELLIIINPRAYRWRVTVIISC